MQIREVTKIQISQTIKQIYRQLIWNTKFGWRYLGEKKHLPPKCKFKQQTLNAGQLKKKQYKAKLHHSVNEIHRTCMYW